MGESDFEQEEACDVRSGACGTYIADMTERPRHTHTHTKLISSTATTTIAMATPVAALGGQCVIDSANDS